MEAAPRHVDIDTLHADLCSIEGDYFIASFYFALFDSIPLHFDAFSKDDLKEDAKISNQFFKII